MKYLLWPLQTQLEVARGAKRVHCPTQIDTGEVFSKAKNAQDLLGTKKGLLYVLYFSYAHFQMSVLYSGERKMSYLFPRDNLLTHFKLDLDTK